MSGSFRAGPGGADRGHREGGRVANGSLFTYFPTKADLFNQLYLELKLGMAAASLQDVPRSGPLRKQFSRMWSNWTRWAVAEPQKRRALALLGVCDEITEETRAAGHQAMAHIGALVERARANGPMRDAALCLVAALMNLDGRGDHGLHDPGPGQRRQARRGRVRGAVAHAGRLIAFFASLND